METVDSGEYDVFENDREGPLCIELEALHGLGGHHGTQSGRRQRRRQACRAEHVAAAASGNRRRRGRDATGVVDQSADTVEHDREESVACLWTRGRGGAVEQALLVRVVGHCDELAYDDSLPD